MSRDQLGVRVNGAGVREVRYLVERRPEPKPEPRSRERAKAVMVAALVVVGAAPILWVLVRMFVR